MPASEAHHPLAKPRAAVAGAIDQMCQFKGVAGSPEMHAIHKALDHAGQAYQHLTDQQNAPVWPRPFEI